MKIKVIIFLTLVLIFGSLMNAFAYVTYDYGYYSSNHDINTTPLGSFYKSQADAAITEWNNSGINSDASVVSSTSSNNGVFEISAGTAYYGQYAVITENSNSTNKVTKFQITINTDLVTTMHSDNFKKSVFSHEIGHSLALNHGGYSLSIMNPNRQS